MSGNTFGTLFKVTTFGESHGDALGCVIDGCPAGIKLDVERIQKELDRRRPGQKAPDAGKAGSASKAAAANAAVTSRSEPDKAEIVSGLFEGVTTGTPVAIIIRNTAQHSADYSNIKDTFRPGHADYTYDAKYGLRDYRGGGRSSGRETAARVAAGAVARQVLEALLHAPASGAQQACKAGAADKADAAFKADGALPFSITAFTTEAAGIECNEFNLDCIEENSMRACDNKAAALMEEKIASLRAEGDSAGGIVECLIRGVPAGLGEPVFDKLDAELAKAMLSIGAVKGIEFGSGFAVARMCGSECNDAMRPAALQADEALSADAQALQADGTAAQPAFATNNAGGILGGISNGNDIIFRVAVKPVPSIAKSQSTVTRNGETAEIEITGRHDACLCPRIVPVVEAMAAITLCDMMLRNRSAHL